MQINYNFFYCSLTNHQKLVNIIEMHINNGERKLSQTKLAKEMGKSPSWVSNAFKQLNVEDKCIAYDKNGIKLNYNDLTNNGVFCKILEMLKATEELNMLVSLNNKQLCEKFNVKETTVQMYRAYVLTGDNHY